MKTLIQKKSGLVGIILALILVSCGKEQGQCSVCTVETKYNGTIISTSTISQKDREAKSSGNCTSTKEEFKQGLIDEVTAQGLDASVICEFE